MATTEEGSGGRIRGAESLGKPAAETGTFAVRGEYWTLGCGATTFPLKDFKGLSYIQRLLQHPGEEFHSLDLLRAPGSISLAETEHGTSAQIEGTDSVGGLGDSGEMLDARAKQEYKRKLLELNEELEDQRERGNHKRAEQITSEIAFLNREISRAIGLGGRDRRAGSASERARLNVTRAIKAALQKISEQQSAMGDLLDRSIKTGSFCSYAPDPGNQVSWRFSMEGPQTLSEPEATEPFLFRRGSTFLRESIDQTTFVGREQEIAILRRSLEQSLRGEGRLVLISGSPGVGKTRIAAEIGEEASNRGTIMFVGNCYDREDSVPFLPFVEILEVALARAPSAESFRDSLAKDAPEIARLLPELRRMFPDIPAPLELSPEQSRRALFNAVAELITRVAGNRSVLLFFDDLQWADEGTLSLLNHLARLVPKLPVFVVAAYRDVELEPTRPLARALDELIHLQFAEQIHLGGLPRKASTAMLRALSGREVPEALANLIYAETEGNPFFIEELFRHLVEQGKLFNTAGEFRLDLKPEEIDVPRSLRLVIGRRLGRLSEEARKILATAGIIGRSFTFDLLEVSTGIDPERILDSLEETERAGLISSTMEYPEARFHFSHELIRQAVVSGLSAARRQHLHLNVADAMERLYATALEVHADDLAHHLWQAGKIADAQRTVQFLAMAARQALTRSACSEAIAHLTKELHLLPILPADAERDRKELFAQSALGIALQAIKGYAAPDADQAYSRAHELAAKIGDTSQLVSVLRGRAFFHAVRAEYKIALKLGQQMLTLGEQIPECLVEGDLVMGLYSLYLGDLASSRFHLERGIAVETPQPIRSRDFQSIGHLRSTCLSYLARTFWLLGYPDQALRHSQEGLALAEKISLPTTLAQAQGMHALLYQVRRETVFAQEWSDKTIAYSRKHGFPYWLTLCSIIKGSLFDQAGQLETGLNQFLSGLDGYRATGAKLGLSWFLALLAELFARTGRVEDGLQAMREALVHVENTGEAYYEPEVRRLNGELLLRKGGTGAQNAAEVCFLQALEAARRQGSKAWELRIATSLARLWRDEQKPREACELLSGIYGWFTEGFSTGDLQDAKLLLDELAQS